MIATARLLAAFAHGSPVLGIVLACLVLACPIRAPAATITATVTDEAGRRLPDAVVMISPEIKTKSPPGSGHLAAATIDQKDETFVPFVTVIHTGGTVTFRNSDPIRHHVYSFSPLRRFEMVEAPGELSPAIKFDQPGSLAIGCNIHDHMIAYIHVTDAPWAMVTGKDGQAVITDIPAGNFIATVWHPRLKPGAEPPSSKVTLAADNSSFAVTIPVLPPRHARGRDY